VRAGVPGELHPVNPEFVEDKETLWQKYRRLQAQDTASP
jgi:hypothetical protein